MPWARVSGDRRGWTAPRIQAWNQVVTEAIWLAAGCTPLLIRSYKTPVVYDLSEACLSSRQNHGPGVHNARLGKT